MKRILTSLVGLPILFAIIKYLPPWSFLLLVLACVLIGSQELHALVEKQGMRPHRLLGTGLAMATAYAFIDPRLEPIDMLGAAALAIPLASLARGWSGATLSQETGAIGATLLTVMMMGLLMGYCLALMSDGNERGRDLTVLLFWVVWLSDAGAYIVGSLAGRRPLAPRISPKKTLEGMAGAMIMAVAAALVAKAWFFRSLSLRDALALGLLMGLFGMLGDLVESLLKRSAQVKDSGWLFPGHGGMLDRADSLLFAAPVLFYYHKYFMT